MTKQIAIKILVYLAGPVLTAVGMRVFRILSERIRYRAFRKFWKFREKSVLIVFPKTQRLPDHDTGFAVERSLNIYSAIGLADIRSFLSQMGYITKLTDSDRDLKPDSKKGNLVLIGGTRGNPVCAEICGLDDICRKLPIYWFTMTKGSKHFLSNRSGTKIFGTDFEEGPLLFRIDQELRNDLEYAPDISQRLRTEFESKGIKLVNAISSIKISGEMWEIADEGRSYIIKKEDDKLSVYHKSVKSDHGIVFSFTNPFDPSKRSRVIVLAGNHGGGTLAAVHAAISRNILSQVSKSIDLGGNIGFVVEGIIDDYDISHLELANPPFNIA